jgi:hypothetical protein
VRLHLDGQLVERADAADLEFDSRVTFLTRPCLRPSSMLPSRSWTRGLRQGLVRKRSGAPGAWQGLHPAPKCCVSQLR